MISADATPEQIDRLRHAGADDYLTKPIDLNKFLSMVDATPALRQQPGSSPEGEPAERGQALGGESCRNVDASAVSGAVAPTIERGDAKRSE